MQFQIQSDFITQASREDIVHSPRSFAVREGVAEAFRDAVVQFCQQPSDLRFQWTKFLPGATISDTFWATLLPRIIAHLQVSPILLSLSALLVQMEAGKARLYEDCIGWPKTQLWGPPPLPLVCAGAAANGRNRERRPPAETPSV